VTKPSLADVKRNRVLDSAIPGWMDDAAAYGVRFVMTKVFPDRRHASGDRLGPVVKWFEGEPARAISGLAHVPDPRAIRLSATMKGWAEIVDAAAHECVHSYGYNGPELYHDHELPTLVGKLAAAHWKSDRTVYVHHGNLMYNWMPPGVGEIRGVTEVPTNAVVLELEGDDANTYLNRGTSTRPAWRQVNLA
jgi:hypothetical protein